MRVAIYCRLSEEDKNKQTEHDDSESIQNQKNMLIEYSLKNGWNIFDIYSDDDFKGSDRNRPEFNRLLLDAEQKKFDIVLCKSQSRFTRELELVEKYIHGKFIEWNIRFIGYTDNADTNNLGNKKQRQINGLVNEWYLEDLSISIKSVFDTKKRAGQHIGAFAPYGYKKNPKKKGHLIIDKEAALIVREIFELFVQGYGKTPIARMLNEKGIPNPTEYKKQQGLRFKHTSKNNNSTLWKYYSIQNILVNEMYIGTMVQNKQRNLSYKNNKKAIIPKSQWIKVANTHEPIIDIELWNKTQALVQQRFKPFGDTSKIGIFAKKVRCIYCGYHLRTQKTNGKHNLQCSTKFISKGSCQGCCIAIHKLEKIVLSELKTIIKSYHIEEKVKSKVVFKARLQENIDMLNQNILDNKRKIEECTLAVKNLYLDKVKEIITECEFIEFSKDFHQDKEKYQTLIQKIGQEIEAIKIKLASTSNKDELIQRYQNIDYLERVHVDALIDYIEIGKVFPKSRNREINIYWNF